MADTQPILVILGATASGKSDVAMTIARQVGGEILSVDSMQVYRGMDIGTAKPSPAEQAEIRHHLIDVVEPNEPFTVARFVEMADDVIRDTRKRNVPLIATGGTPLYYKALFEGLFDGPGADDAIRDRLKLESGEVLHRRLSEVDPAAALRIHANDTRRLVRALEVFEITGQPISSFQNDWTDPVLRHASVWVGLNWDKEALNRRINARVKSMMAAGWVDEVRRLLETNTTLSQTAGEATGYRELFDHLRGKGSESDVIEQIKIATRQLARRQMKWLRRFPNVRWMNGDQPVGELARAILPIWNVVGATPASPSSGRRESGDAGVAPTGNGRIQR